MGKMEVGEIQKRPRGEALCFNKEYAYLELSSTSNSV
jgi:hypothetical protein